MVIATQACGEDSSESAEDHGKDHQEHDGHHVAGLGESLIQDREFTDEKAKWRQSNDGQASDYERNTGLRQRYAPSR